MIKKKDKEQLMNDEEIVDETIAVDNSLQQENDELKTQLKRVLADYQNLQRRVQEDRQGFVKFATEQLLLDLLPVVDNLQVAVETAPEDEQKSAWFQAVAITANQLKEMLKREGIEEINPENDLFDGAFHEAVDVVEGEEGKVTKVHQKGYKLHGKVVRPARVQVGKGIKHET